MKNSILLTYRDRPQQLRLCLQALNQSMLEDCELIITTQCDAKYPIFNYLPLFIDVNINYKWIWIRKSGLFCKSLLLNKAFENSAGEYITILDVDCLTPRNFFYEMEYPELNSKICHNVKLLDSEISAKIHRGGIAEFNAQVQRNGRYPLAPMKSDNKIMGNSQFTINKIDFIKTGLYDEKFEGYGPEDAHMNVKIDKLGIKGIENTKNHLWHLHHQYNPDWRNNEEEFKNRKHYCEERDKIYKS